MRLNDIESTPRILQEGLIRVPQQTLAWCNKTLIEVLLWRIRENFTPDKRARYPDHYKAFKEQVKSHRITLPKKKFYTPGDDGLWAYEGKITSSMMPGYPEFEAVDLFFVVNLSNTRYGGAGDAAYMHRLDAVIINMFTPSNRGILYYPSGTSPESLPDWFNHISALIEHELRHAVQFMILKHDDQIARRSNYEQNEDDYYLSAIEFDPQIGSEVRSFINMQKIIESTGRPVDLKSSILSFVGLKEVPPFSPFSANAFFRTLRRRAPEKYKLAVRKFYVELLTHLNPERTQAE